MHIDPHVFQDVVPTLLGKLSPPEVHGMASLAHRAYAGTALAELLELVDRPVASEAEDAAPGISIPERAATSPLLPRGAP